MTSPDSDPASAAAEQRAAERRFEERQRLKSGVDAAIAAGAYDDALRQADEAARRFEAAGDREGQALASTLQAKCSHRLNEFPAALAAYQESYEAYAALGDSLGQAEALRGKGISLRLMGRDNEAIQSLEQGLALCRQGNHRDLEMRTLTSLSVLYKQTGDIAASQEMLYECLTFFEGNGTPKDAAPVLLNIANNYLAVDDLDEGIRFARRGIALYEAAEDLHNLSMALYVLGGAYRLREEYETALEQFRAARHIAEHVGHSSALALTLDEMADVLMFQKRFDEARDVLEHSLQINGSDGNRVIYSGHLAAMGRLYSAPEYARHDAVAASEYLTQALSIAEEQDTVSLLVDIHDALAELYERRGEFALAVQSLRALRVAEKRLFNAESDKRIKQLELEKAKKDAQIAHLRAVELAEALAEAERLRRIADEWARTDALTGLLNRRALDETLDQEFERACQTGHPFAVALLDIDFFKRINDTLGHAIGDNVIYQVGQILRAHCGSENRIARYGGEEFAILFPETNLFSAITICERIREAVATVDRSKTHPDLETVTVSAGVSVVGPSTSEYPPMFERCDSPSALLAEADRNLYLAKVGGRNRVVGSAGTIV